jgi:hypothetical protein
MLRQLARPKSPPWFAAYERALRQQRTPMVYMLVSWHEAEQLARGFVSVQVRRQAERLLTWRPRA